MRKSKEELLTKGQELSRGIDKRIKSAPDLTEHIKKLEDFVKEAVDFLED